MTRAHYLRLAAAVLLALLLCGCAKEAAPLPREGALVTPQESQGKYDFIFVCPMVDNSYWIQCAEGIRRADAELGTSTKIIGPTSGEDFAAEIVPYIAQAVQEHPDGILAYAGLEGMTPYIEEAAQAGIPVVAVDSDALTLNRTAYVGVNLYTLGHKAGETLATLTGGSARVGYICSRQDASSELSVFAAMKDAVHDFDIEVVAVSEGYNSVARAQAAARQMLTEHPEITAIFCTGGMNVTGAAKYLEEAGLDIPLVGLEDTEENLNYVRSGYIDALLVQSPGDMGYLSIHVLKEYLDKGLLSTDVFNTSATLVTLENVDTYASASFYPDMSLKLVRVGYYTGDAAFQSGYSEDARKSGYAYEYYQAIAALAGWRYEYVYGSRTEMLDALRRGEVDMVAGVYQSDNNQDHFRFTTLDMGLGRPKRYFAVNEQREDLLDELNGAMSKLQEEQPTFLTALYNKYYSQYAGIQVLTDAEQELLSGLECLRLGYMRSNMPLCDQDSDGNPTGLVKDLIAHIVNYTHCPILPVAYDTTPEMNEALARGEIDVAFPSYADTWIGEQNGLRQSNAFVSDRVMLLYAGDYSEDLLSHIAANRRGIGQEYYVSTYYPNATLTFYDSRAQVLEAILKGDERCTVGYSSSMQRFLFANPQYNDLHIAYLPTDVELGMAVSEENSYYLSILNKAVENMGAAAIHSATLAYSGVAREVTLAAYVQEHSLSVILILAVFLTVVGLLFYRYIRQAQRLRAAQLKTNASLTARAGGGGERQPGQDPVPVLHEPRHPHPHERHCGHDGGGGKVPGGPGAAAGLPGEDQPLRRAPADPD